MALSRNLHSALIEFVGSLKEDDHNAPYVARAVTRLRHAETDGIAEYEDIAFAVLTELFDLQRQHDPNAPSAKEPKQLADGGVSHEEMTS